MHLWFDRNGWLLSDGEEFDVYLYDSPRYWEGMHPYIQEKFDNKLHGTITHYDALHKASRDSTRLHLKSKGCVNSLRYWPRRLSSSTNINSQSGLACSI